MLLTGNTLMVEPVNLLTGNLVLEKRRTCVGTVGDLEPVPRTMSTAFWKAGRVDVPVVVVRNLDAVVGGQAKAAGALVNSLALKVCDLCSLRDCSDLLLDSICDAHVVNIVE